MGRKPKEISKEAFEGLCKLQCTEQEICGFLKVTDKTLSGWCDRTYGCGFSEAFKRFSQDGKISLRRAQFRLAEKSAAMAIWLGKQYLGQRDLQEVTVTGIDETERKMREYFHDTSGDT